MALLARKDKPLQVEIPGPKEDRAITSKVGVVAAIGFIVGVAWPRIFGFQVGPDAPGATPERPAATAQQQAKAPGSAPTAEPTAAGSAPEPEAGPSNKQTVAVGDGTVRNCKNKKGDKLDDCGKVGIDKLVKPRLAGLSSCPSAIGLDGKLKLGVAVNFDKSEVVVVEDEKSQLPSSTVRGVMSCAAEELKGIELDKVTHTHPRYTVAYEISFLPPGRTADAEGEPSGGGGEEAGLGKATVTWEKALVRESEKEGKVVARLPQGTRVKILEQKDDWFLIESGKSKGWVYRQAIGK